MSGVKAKLRQLSYKLRHDFLTFENVVLVVAIALCLLWTYQSVEAMSRNWQLSERLTTSRKELELLSIEVETAELENEYYKTEEYQELAARKLLDKQLPGEHMVSLPENSAVARAKDNEANVTGEEKTYSNFEKWMKFLFPYY